MVCSSFEFSVGVGALTVSQSINQSINEHGSVGPSHFNSPCVYNTNTPWFTLDSSTHSLRFDLEAMPSSPFGRGELKIWSGLRPVDSSQDCTPAWMRRQPKIRPVSGTSATSSCGTLKSWLLECKSAFSMFFWTGMATKRLIELWISFANMAIRNQPKNHKMLVLPTQIGIY